jgi:LysM repeat protein
MNDKFTNNQHDEDIARKLTQIAEQTNAHAQFAAELEEKLRSAHQPKAGWWLTFNQISPTLRWVGLMVVLAVVLSWSIRTLIPAPQPAEENTQAAPGLSTPTSTNDSPIQTPAAEGEGIEFRGAQLYMNVPLPDSPTQANIYAAIASQPATAEYAQSLAQQFGIAGDVYLALGPTQDTTGYMVTDGKQQLIVLGENNYSYTSDMLTSSRTYNGFVNENAESIIREFLDRHGFDADVRLVDSASFNGYTLQQIAPDGLPIEYESYSQPSVRITLNEDGSVLGMTVLLVSYDPNHAGSFGIISADEALQRLLDDNLSAGKIETTYGGGPDENFIEPPVWYQSYPDGQTLTIHGNISSSQAVDANKPAVVFLDSVQAIGNISGMDALDYYTFVQATGQFIVEDGVRRFNVESWSADVQAAYAFGWARKQGDQIIVVNEDGSGTEYVLVDPPADLPLDITFPDSQISVNGALIDGQIHWTMISYYPSGGGGGGGGGGGMGFYQLNLSGTPIPFPTATLAMPGTTYTIAELASFQKHPVQEGDTLDSIAAAYNVSVDDLARVNNISDASMVGAGWVLTIPGVAGPIQLDGEEGIMQVQIFEKPDGRLREAYTFISTKDQTYYEVTGINLEELRDVANRPIKIWGAISYDQMGAPFLAFERFESLYPDLQFEVVKGTQQTTEIDGMNVVLFTTDGTTYIQMISSGGYPDYSTYDDTGEVNLEVLRIPDETYAGYPTLRVFNSGPAINNATGQQMELPRVTDTLVVMPDPYGNADTFVSPDVIIDRVELIYLTDNPAYRNTESATQVYLQPVWHFQGHYSNGDVLDFLVQALKQEYLSPELSPHEPPG